jgi:hypothetical protein
MDCRSREMPIIAVSTSATISRQRRAFPSGSSLGIAISIWPTGEHSPTSASCMRTLTHVPHSHPTCACSTLRWTIPRTVSYAVPSFTLHTDCMLARQGCCKGMLPHGPSIVARILSCGKSLSRLFIVFRRVRTCGGIPAVKVFGGFSHIRRVGRAMLLRNTAHDDYVPGCVSSEVVRARGTSHHDPATHVIAEFIVALRPC